MLVEQVEQLTGGKSVTVSNPALAISQVGERKNSSDRNPAVYR